MSRDVGINQKAYSDSKVDDIANQDGQIDELPILGISIDDKELVTSLNRKIKDSQDYWNDPNGYNLEVARDQNVRMHLGKQLDKSKLYSYQVPYIDNEIFVGTETVIAYVTSTNPQSEAYPANDTVQSKIMAADLQKVHKAHADKFDLQSKLNNVARNLYLKRVGILKLSYDPKFGSAGDIIPSAVNPEHVIFDKNARMGEDPNFVCEILKASVEDLVNRFPEKKEAIFQSVGIVRGTPIQLGKVVAYREVWFTFWEKTKRCQGLAIYFNDVVLYKGKNPNWIYEKEKGITITNFLDVPVKPYIIFNYINDGAHVIDQTTPVEQAAPLQDILNKRGRQIIENADTANSTLVLKAGAISSDDAQNITGDPNQKIILDSKDQPVQSAYGEIEPHMLPNYVLDDKIDLRNTIHNILGTPSQFRGENGNQTDTLGEAVMIKNQASGRQDAIIRAMDAGMARYWNLLTQMMKVHYTKIHYWTINGDDGDFDFIEMSRENISDVAFVRQQTGSTLPYDKEKQETIAINLAKLGLIDPYNLYQDLHLPNADKRFDAFLKWKMDAESLRATMLDETADRTAYIDFIESINGATVKPRDDVTKEHILSHREQMMSDKFLTASKDKQQKFIDHVQAEVNRFGQKVDLDEASAAGMLTNPDIPVTIPLSQLMQMQQGMMGQPGQPGAPQAGNPLAQPPIKPEAPQLPLSGPMEGGGQLPVGLPPQPQIEKPAMPPVMPAAGLNVASILQEQ